MKLYLKELFIKPLNTIFICLGFVIAIYCLSIGTSLFNVKFNFYNDNNNFWNENFVAKFSFKEDLSLSDFIDKVEKCTDKRGFLSSKYTIYREDRVNFLTGVYNHEHLESIYPLYSGRYFTKEESISNKKIALVGNKIMDLSYVESGVRYIDIQGEKFQVVGVIGRDTMSYWGIQILVPMNSLPKETYNSKSKEIEMCYPKDMLNREDYFNKLKLLLNEKKIIDIKVEHISPNNASSKAFDNNKPTYVSLIFSIALSLISIATFSTFWANAIKKNIAIKRIVGASNLHILKMLAFQVFFIVCTATFVSFVLNNITLNFLKDVFLTKVEFNVINVVIIGGFTFLITILNTLWIYRNILKFDILDDIR